MIENARTAESKLTFNDLTIRGLNGIVHGAIFLKDTYLSAPSLSHSETSEMENALNEYKTYLYRSPHYKVELGHYERTIQLYRGDYARLNHTDAKKGRSIPTEFSGLLSALNNYLLTIYAFDDLTDNSPYRGEQIAYHLIKPPQHIRDMYSFAKSALVEHMSQFSESAALELHSTITACDSVMESEGSDHYYRFNFEEEHTPQYAFMSLSKKAQFLSTIAMRPLQEVEGMAPPSEWSPALKKGYEAAWLASDYYKNISGKGVTNWIEIKSGRLPLPVVVALSNYPESLRANLIEDIKHIWELYKPYFQQPFDLRLLQNLVEFDKTETAKASIAQFVANLKRGDVESTIKQEINNRKRSMMNTSQQFGGVDHLDFFLAGINGYLAEKKIKNVLNNL